ncbi:hypothetical protein J3F84DRAFT_366579 [Trichoderma pleuroticola]
MWLAVSTRKVDLYRGCDMILPSILLYLSSYIYRTPLLDGKLANSILLSSLKSNLDFHYILDLPTREPSIYPVSMYSLYNLHSQMFHFFNVLGNVGTDEFLFTSTRNNGVIWTAKVIVVAPTQAFPIADAINDLYSSLTLGTGVHVYRGGTAAVASVASATVGALIEMISMTNGGSGCSLLKRDEDLSARASCGSGTQ